MAYRPAAKGNNGGLAMLLQALISKGEQERGIAADKEALTQRGNQASSLAAQGFERDFTLQQMQEKAAADLERNRELAAQKKIDEVNSSYATGYNLASRVNPKNDIFNGGVPLRPEVFGAGLQTVMGGQGMQSGLLTGLPAQRNLSNVQNDSDYIRSQMSASRFGALNAGGVDVGNTKWTAGGTYQGSIPTTKTQENPPKMLGGMAFPQPPTVVHSYDPAKFTPAGMLGPEDETSLNAPPKPVGQPKPVAPSTIPSVEEEAPKIAPAKSYTIPRAGLQQKAGGMIESVLGLLKPTGANTGYMQPSGNTTVPNEQSSLFNTKVKPQQAPQAPSKDKFIEDRVAGRMLSDNQKQKIYDFKNMYISQQGKEPSFEEIDAYIQVLLQR